MKRHYLSVAVLVGVVALAVGPVWAAPRLSLGPQTVSAPAPHQAPTSGLRDLVGAPVLFGMGIKIKDLGTLSAKFVRNAGNAQNDYKDGVANAGGDWESNTKASEPNYEAGVQDGISRKAFGKGVAAAGAAKYQTNAVNLGPGRFAQGVANAKDAWARGFAPAASVLSALQLPPKGPRRSPQNQQRSQAVAVALGAMKTNR